MTGRTGSSVTPQVDAQGIDWTHRWVQWGKGRHHIQEAGATVAVCGRELPDGPMRVAVYMPSGCARCRSHEEAYQAAEAYRGECWEYMQGLRDDALSHMRKGRFRVLRCRKCGAQHATNGDGRGGVPFCMTAGHQADLEEVEAIGPAWEGDSDA